MNGIQMRQPLISSTEQQQQQDEALPDLSKQGYPPENGIGFFSMLFFSWVWPILQRARKGALTPSDFYAAPDYLKAASYVGRFEQNYFKLKLQGTSSRTLLFWTVIRTFKKQFLVKLWFMRVIYLALTILRPVILRQLLVNVSLVFEQPLTSDQQYEFTGLKLANFSLISEPFYWSCSLAIISFLIALVNHHFWMRGVQLALSVRGSLIGLVYRKSLRLHSRHRSEYPSGRITNLTSVDGDAIMNSMWGSVHEIWSSPVLITLLVIGLLIELGPSALCGLVVLLLSLSLTSWLAKLMSGLQDQIMRKSDLRVTKISEALTAIKLIKLYSWQFAFTQSIEQTRKEQEKLLYKSNSIGAITRVLGLASPLFVSFCSFVVYIYLGHELDASTTFTSLLLFQQLKEPLGKLPEAVNSIVKAHIAIKRIQTFLDCTNQETLVRAHPVPGSISIENGSFTWDADIPSTTPPARPLDGRVESPLPVLPSSAELVSQRIASAMSDQSIQSDLIAHNHSPPNLQPVLKSINLSVEPGKLVMIVGNVGSGKSSLIACLLGEMRTISGQVSISPNIAFTSQLAFLHSASVRDNILFGRPFKKELYEQTLSSCDLNEDLKQFSDSDLTLVGESGITLSGGQRARLALARAIYSEADIYLFDEPLSAVDARVALHLFDKIIARDGVLAGKTRILVTHQLQFAPRVDEIIVIDSGQIQHRGSYSELRDKGLDFRAVVTEAHTGTVHDQSKSPRLSSPVSRSLPRLSSGGTASSVDQLLLDKNEIEPDIETTSSKLAIVHTSTMGQRDLTDETLSTRRMTRAVYLAYFHAGASNIVWLIVVLLVVASQAGVVLSDYLLAWTSDEEGNESQKRFLIYYLIAIIVASALLLMRSVSLAFITTKASSSLHSGLVSGLMRARQSFHDITPTGRLLNRVGKDIDLLDTQMPGVVQDIASCSIAVFGTIVLTVAVVPLSVPLLLIIFGVYLWIQRHYRPASVATKRLESITRSPIYQQVNSSCSGLMTLRAFRNSGALQREYAELAHRLDLNTRIYFMLFGIHRWMGIKLEALGCVLVLFAAAASLWVLPQLSSGLIGLVITVSLSLSGQLHWLVRQRTELEVQLNGVERILEYSEETPEESDERFAAGRRYEREKFARVRAAPSRLTSNDHYINLEMVEGHANARGSQLGSAQNLPVHHLSDMIIPPDSWPARGEIRWNDVTVGYREDTPAVLHHVSFTIKAGEKIGIVGRTGSSKSTLSLALFRLMEARSGVMLIDDIPIQRVPLHILRSKLSMIPQEPVLFATSVRNNLDPFHRASDAEIYRVLDQVSLRDVIEMMGGLHALVSDSGENLSVGQRQLLCLARALLRKSKILVMDEASSSLDLHADMAMKRVISDNFSHCTIITIAHRLNSVLGSDRIMVMDTGKLVEFDSPSKLIAHGGHLARLLKDASSMTQEMRDSGNDSKSVAFDDTKEGGDAVLSDSIRRVG